MIPHTWQDMSVRTLHETQRNHSTRGSLSPVTRSGVREEGRQTFVRNSTECLWSHISSHLVCHESCITTQTSLNLFPMKRKYSWVCSGHQSACSLYISHQGFSSRKDAVPPLEFHHRSTCTVISFFTVCPSPNGTVTMSYFSTKVFTHVSLVLCRFLYSILGTLRPCDPQTRQRFVKYWSATLLIIWLDNSCSDLKLSPRFSGFTVTNHFFITSYRKAQRGGGKIMICHHK